MNLAVISLVALAIAVTLSCTTKINVGILAMALAWVIGVYLAGRPFSEIAAGFPTQLFLTLVGVTLLFTQAKVNGTLDKIATMPWGPILMVSGVTVLIALIEKTGGIDLFSAILASLSSLETVPAVVAFIAGSISIDSSTSGVVLPAFLPTVPGLVERLGGSDPLPVAWA